MRTKAPLRRDRWALSPLQQKPSNLPNDPLEATVDEVGAWDAKHLIASSNRNALLVQSLLWAGADIRQLIQQYLDGAKQKTNFRQKLEDALTMVQVGQRPAGADEETKIMLRCARLYLSYRLLDLRPCAGKTMEIPWHDVRDRVDLFVLMLGNIVEKNDGKLFTASRASQLKEHPSAEHRSSRIDVNMHDAASDANTCALAHENAPLQQQSEAHSEQTQLDTMNEPQHATTSEDTTNITPPTPPPMSAHTKPTTRETNIATIMAVAKCSEDEAKRYLEDANGDLQQAMLKSLTPAPVVAAAEEPRLPTLIDDALEAYAATLQVCTAFP